MSTNISPHDVTEKPDNMRYHITSLTFSLTAKTTQNYNTHKYFCYTLISHHSHDPLCQAHDLCTRRFFLPLTLYTASYNEVVKESTSHMMS